MFSPKLHSTHTQSSQMVSCLLYNVAPHIWTPWSSSSIVLPQLESELRSDWSISTSSWLEMGWVHFTSSAYIYRSAETWSGRSLMYLCEETNLDVKLCRLCSLIKALFSGRNVATKVCLMLSTYCMTVEYNVSITREQKGGPIHVLTCITKPSEFLDHDCKGHGLSLSSWVTYWEA